MSLVRFASVSLSLAAFASSAKGAAAAVIASTAVTAVTASIAAAQEQVGRSPWGPDDELGRLNLMTDESRTRVLSRIAGGRIYDLSVEYFIGMPGWHAAGDPHYQFWMTHTPRGTVVSDPLKVGKTVNQHISYTGSALSMYTHTGTHIDALNHFGIDGQIYNRFKADEHLGDRGWGVTGAETIPPVVARGVLIDVAKAKGVNALADGYRITRADLEQALTSQRVSVARGDVVLIRTGRMQVYENADRYMANPPGLGLDGARYLVEEKRAMIIGATT